MKHYDVAIIGGGPGGYVAAIRASKEGYKTVLIEAKELGGTCLNRGCIPSKTLLKHAEVIDQLEKAKSWGIMTSLVELSLPKMKERKNQVINTLRAGIEHLLRVGKIDVIKGYGKVEENHLITVDCEQRFQIQAEKIIIATGSSPSIPPIQGLDTVEFDTTDTIFDVEEIPSTLTIIGGGVIGVELATIFASFGTKVNLIELGERLIPTEDVEASKVLQKKLKITGIQLFLKQQVQSVSPHNGEITVLTEDGKGKPQQIISNRLLIATGRKANLKSVEALPIEIEKGVIVVDDYLQTSIPNIFAIGDVIGRLQLAHVASQEGLVAVANLMEKRVKMSYDVIPRCIYTNPQVASVGRTEEELKKKNIPYKVEVFSHQGNGKALTMGETEGFTKLIIDPKYGEILGAVMVGSNVTEMIGQASSYMFLEGTIDELAMMVQPHPSLSETMQEVANNLIGQGIHSL